MNNKKFPKMLIWMVGMALFMQIHPLQAKEFVWYDGSQAVSYHIQKNVDSVVKVAADMFVADIIV